MTTTLLFVTLILLLLLLVDTRKQRKKLERYFAVLNVPGLARRSKEQARLLAQAGLKNLINEAAGLLDSSAFTLILPTHNRHAHLCRALDFYAGWNVKVIVMDSTAAPFDRTIPREIQYVHCPRLSFGEKLKEALEKVETRYVLLSADDDFISPVAVKDVIKFLDEHPEHACAQGWHAGFSPRKKKRMKWLSMHLFAKELQVDGSDPGERILKQCASYMNCFYALHRTPVLKYFFCQVCPSLPKETILKRPELLEIGQAVNTVAHGGHATLPMLWIAREMIVDSAGASAQASNAQADPSVAAKQEEEVFQALATALAGVIGGGDANVLFQQALRSYTSFKGKWARQMFAHFGPVENVVYSPEDAALVHQVEKLVRKHPLTQG